MSKLWIGLMATVVGTALIVAAPAASARDHTNWSVNIDVPGAYPTYPAYSAYGAPVTYAQPPVVYTRPAPVYVQPAPVYYAPAPVYVSPVRVYERDYYRYHDRRPHHWDHGWHGNHGRYGQYGR